MTNLNKAVKGINPRLVLCYFIMIELTILDANVKNVSGNGNNVFMDVNLLYTLKHFFACWVFKVDA